MYLAWGQPQQKGAGVVRNTPTESWVYTRDNRRLWAVWIRTGLVWWLGIRRAGVVSYGFHHGHRFYGAFA